MKGYAADIVLLPPDEAMDLAIEYNRALTNGRRDEIVLDKDICMPHISLVMGKLSADRLQEATLKLKRIAGQHDAIDLSVPYIKGENAGTGSTVSFEFERNDKLIRLHEALVETFSPLLSQDASVGDMYDPPPIDPSAIEWINQYISRHSFDNFWPHITLGFGALPVKLKPFSFTASRLAICHLGNHCTCRKILAEVPLRQQQ